MPDDEELTEREIEEIAKLVRERMASIEFVLEEGPDGSILIGMKDKGCDDDDS